MKLARISGLAVAATAALALSVSSGAEDKGIDYGSSDTIIPPDPPPTQLTDGFIRISQESSPMANDFDANILGDVLPFECDDSAAHFYGYGEGCYNGCYLRLQTLADRSQMFFAQTTDGMTLFVVHDGVIEDLDGGYTEMMFDLRGDPNGAFFSARDDPTTPTNYDRYTGHAGSSLFGATHHWSPLRTDGEALSGLDGEWTMFVAFADLDGSPSTPTIEGIDEWVATSANGQEFSLALEEGRRVRFEFVTTCTPDIVENGAIDFDDLLAILSNWGPCP